MQISHGKKKKFKIELNEQVMHGQSQPSKRSLEKNHCFHIFGANQNLGQFGIVIRMSFHHVIHLLFSKS
jgi:hypothetical protein